MSTQLDTRPLPLERICSGCGAVQFTLYIRVLWANQHGFKWRYFCDACGLLEDVRLLYRQQPHRKPVATVTYSKRRTWTGERWV